MVKLPGTAQADLSHASARGSFRPRNRRIAARRCTDLQERSTVPAGTWLWAGRNAPRNKPEAAGLRLVLHQSRYRCRILSSPHSTAKHVVKVESLEVRCEPGEHTAAGLEQGIVKTGAPLRLRGAVGLQNLLRQTPNWSSHRSTADSDCQNLLCAALQHSVCRPPSERQCDILCPPVSLRLVRFSTQPTVP